MHYLTEVVKVLFFRASRVPENVIELPLKARQRSVTQYQNFFRPLNLFNELMRKELFILPV